MVSQVVLKKTVTVHPTLRLCGQRVLVVYGVWQMFLPMENCISTVMSLRQTACHRGWSPLPNLLPSLPPKLPNLVPKKPSKRATKPAAQVVAKPAAKPATGEPIPVAPFEHVQLFKVKYLGAPLRRKKWHTEPIAQ